MQHLTICKYRAWVLVEAEKVILRCHNCCCELEQPWAGGHEVMKRVVHFPTISVCKRGIACLHTGSNRPSRGG